MAQLVDSPVLSVCIATRNRPDCLIKCLKSLSLLEDLLFEIIVVDDASDEPLAPRIRKDLDSNLIQRLQIIRYEENRGPSVARNEAVSRARAPYVLQLDEDAMLCEAVGIHRALEVLKNDPSIGAVGLSQVKEDGTAWQSYTQPSPVSYPCLVPSFYGWGCVLRRDLFLELGGYKETMWFCGEEDEYCKRLLNRGFYVVYLPQARVIHSYSEIGRDRIMRMRFACRNKCFDAAYNEPLPLMLVSIPWRILGYIRWRKVPSQYYNFSDKGGVRWILRELFTKFPAVWSERHPLKWITYLRWRKIRKGSPVYNSGSSIEHFA
jgi:GT2 family glycosyltransferase